MKKKVNKKIKSSFDMLGSIGNLGAIIQSTVIKLGTVSEKLVKAQFLANGFEDINSVCPVIADANKKNVKKYYFGNEFLNSFDPDKKYIGQKVVFTYEGRNIQTDLIIYKDKTFYVIEVKSSSQFDTKKAQAEQSSLFENTLVLNKLIYKSFNNKFEDYKIKGAVCCISADDKLEIFTGFKQYICDNTKIWQDDDFANIVRGMLSIIKRQDLFNEDNIDVILKAFIQSPIERHDFFREPIVKKYVNFVFTGQELFDLFELDYQFLCDERTRCAKDILMATLEEKINGAVDPELFNMTYDIINKYSEYDKRIDREV